MGPLGEGKLWNGRAISQQLISNNVYSAAIAVYETEGSSCFCDNGIAIRSSAWHAVGREFSVQAARILNLYSIDELLHHGWCVTLVVAVNKRVHERFMEGFRRIVEYNSFRK